MAEAIRAARPHELARMRMDENLTFFEDAMGSCERILRCGGLAGWEVQVAPAHSRGTRLHANVAT